MKLLLLSTAITLVHGRCPNDCSGKGVCNAASVCECYANYFGNDCSQRLCYFSKAFTDTGLGDINFNGQIDTDQQVFYSYSNGLIGEQYDPNYGIARADNTKQWDEAHFYRECSNAGKCNRKTGLCECYPGYEGEGCQRTACPLGCSGHGQCVLVEDKNTEYRLWDEDKTQMCVCDPGYSGPGCEKRECPSSVDPVQYPHTDVDVVYKVTFKQKVGDFEADNLPNGPTLFTLTYMDDFGDIWTTTTNTVFYSADCITDKPETKPDDEIDTQYSPETKSDSTCVSTPFVADNGNLRNEGEVWVGDVLDNDFLAEFYQTSFIYDETFLAEQVNNSLKSLPNDLIRNPYTWVSFNPVHTNDNDHTNLGDKGFLYPANSVPSFWDASDAFTKDAGRDWTYCHYNVGSGENGDFCGQYEFGDGPSKFTDSPKYRFPYINLVSPFQKFDGDGEQAAEAYLNCAYGQTCLFIRIEGAANNKKLDLQYHYKPRKYTFKDDGVDEDGDKVSKVNLERLQVTYGKEVKGAANDAGSFVTLEIVGKDSNAGSRQWFGEIDGTPVVDFNTDPDVHACSKRGLCDYDTGVCDCFYGYTSVNCGTRTPSLIQDA